MKKARFPVRTVLCTVFVLGAAWALPAQTVWTENAPVSAGGSVVAAFGSVSWTVGFETLHPMAVAPWGTVEPGLLHAVSSVSSCPEDLNGDGFISSTDLLSVLSAFGTLNSGPADLDGDGQVGSTDLLILLAVFGNSCP